MFFWVIFKLCVSVHQIHTSCAPLPWKPHENANCTFVKKKFVCKNAAAFSLKLTRCFFASKVFFCKETLLSSFGYMSTRCMLVYRVCIKCVGNQYWSISCKCFLPANWSWLSSGIGIVSIEKKVHLFSFYLSFFSIWSYVNCIVPLPTEIPGMAARFFYHWGRQLKSQPNEGICGSTERSEVLLGVV